MFYSIPGELIALVTFPGVVMHEIAHRFMCDILRIPVYDVSYFAIGKSRAGHVYHHATNNVLHRLLIGIAPLFINTFFCMLFTLPYSASYCIVGEGISGPLSMFLYWVGFSMGANAFPSNQDMENVVEIAGKNSSFFINILYNIMKGLNFLRRIWIDFAYAYVISIILPYFIFGCSNI